MNIIKSLAILLMVAGLSWLLLPGKTTTSFTLPDGNIEVHHKITDFVVYYSAALIAAEGNPDKIYDFWLNEKTQSDVLGHKDFPYHLNYLYPPHSLLFFAPLYKLKYVQALHIWQAITVAGVMLLLAMLYYAGICNSFKSLALTAFLLVISYPYMTALAEGQPVIWMLAGVLGSQLLAKNKHFAWAGLLLVITAFKPQLAVAPVLYLLIIYGAPLWRALIASGLAVFAICTGIFGAHIWLDFVQAITSVEGNSAYNNLVLTKMCNLRMLMLSVFGSEYFSVVNQASIAASFAGIIMSGWLAFKVRGKSQAVLELGFALIIAVTLFLSPWIHAHTLILLVISIGYLLKYSGKWTLVAVIAALFILNPFLVALFLPGLTEAYLGLNLLLWVPAQILLIGAIAYRLAGAWNEEKFLEKAA